jgi:hypothetical protein
MNLMKMFGVTVVTLAATGWLLAGHEAAQKMSIEMLINDLSSGDGGKRTAATKEIFRRGKVILPDLEKAGAKQVAPAGATLDTKRLDMVYSVLEGFPPNPPNARGGYKTDSFGLHVEKGTPEDEIQKMCKKYGCTLVGKFTPASLPSCYLKIGPGPALEALIQQILSAEPKVTTINLNYFEG